MVNMSKMLMVTSRLPGLGCLPSTVWSLEGFWNLQDILLLMRLRRPWHESMRSILANIHFGVFPVDRVITAPPAVAVSPSAGLTAVADEKVAVRHHMPIKANRRDVRHGGGSGSSVRA